MLILLIRWIFLFEDLCQSMYFSIDFRSQGCSSDVIFCLGCFCHRRFLFGLMFHVYGERERIHEREKSERL